MKRLSRVLSTPAQCQKFAEALTRFIAYHEREGTERQFIPYWSTFSNCWEDWTDENTGEEVKGDYFDF